MNDGFVYEAYFVLFFPSILIMLLMCIEKETKLKLVEKILF